MEEHLSLSKNRKEKKEKIDDWGIGQPLGW